MKLEDGFGCGYYQFVSLRCSINSMCHKTVFVMTNWNGFGRIFTNLFIYGLLNEAVSNSDYIEPNGKAISDYYV
jgi:hypothetical protein